VELGPSLACRSATRISGGSTKHCSPTGQGAGIVRDAMFQQHAANRRVELSWPVEAYHFVLGNEGDEQEVQQRYRDNGNSKPCFPFEFHFTTSSNSCYQASRFDHWSLSAIGIYQHLRSSSGIIAVQR